MMANVLPYLLMMYSTQDLHHVLPTGSDNAHASSLCEHSTNQNIRAHGSPRSELFDNIIQSNLGASGDV